MGTQLAGPRQIAPMFAPKLKCHSSLSASHPVRSASISFFLVSSMFLCTRARRSCCTSSALRTMTAAPDDPHAHQARSQEGRHDPDADQQNKSVFA